MAKFEEPFEDTQNLLTAIATNAGLTQSVNIKLLTNNRLKEIFKVVKANDLLQHMTKEDVVVLLNEKIFEQLTAEQKTMVIDEALASISYDQDNEKVVISKPDIITHSGVLRKYTYATYAILKESIKTLYQVEKDEEDAAKATTEKAKKKKY